MREIIIVIVKVGTRVLFDREGKIRLGTFRSLAEQIVKIYEWGFYPIVITSGASACGNGSNSIAMGTLEKQIAALIGQPKLMEYWGQAFDKWDVTISQMLLTHEYARKEEIINLLRHQLECRIIPIINENDAVSTEEINNDNDALAAIVSIGIKTSRLIILSDVNGFYPANPRTNPGLQPFKLVKRVDEKILAMAEPNEGDQDSGMKAKLYAAKEVMEAGIMVHLAHGWNIPDVIPKILEATKPGSAPGTTFEPQL